jgi:hypothetical protein
MKSTMRIICGAPASNKFLRKVQFNTCHAGTEVTADSLELVAVGPEWNGQCLKLRGVEFTGHDLGSPLRNVESPEECCSACVHNGHCFAWTWNDGSVEKAYRNTCFLKNTVGGPYNRLMKDSATVSGFRCHGAFALDAKASEYCAGLCTKGHLGVDYAPDHTRCPRAVSFDKRCVVSNGFDFGGNGVADLR